MLKVMIVEDEMFVRLGIKMSVDWASLSMEVVADAANGLQAYELYQKHRPDIILTDIKMPAMDGLEFIRKIRETDTDTRIVILTCYEEFSYAQEALSLDVSEYILKLTMSQDEMTDVLRRVKETLGRTRGVAPTPAAPDEAWMENAVFELLFYHLIDGNGFARQLRLHNKSFSGESLAICVMDIDHYGVMQEKFKDKQGRLIRFAIENMVREIIVQYGDGMFVHERDNRYLMILSFPRASASEKVNALAESVRTSLKTYFNTTVTLGVSSISGGFDALPRLYGEALATVECKFVIGINRVINREDVTPMKLAARMRDVLAELEATLQSMGFTNITVPEALTQTDAVHMKDILLAYFSDLPGALSAGRVRLAANTGQLSTYRNAISQCECLSEYVEESLRFARLFSHGEDFSKPIADAVAFINDNYAQGFSLGKISAYLGLSPNYLCGLFKKEVGCSITQYLMTYRVEKAKELLRTSRQKSYEIAFMLGFTDESYFSRIFKRMTGMSPQEYRKTEAGCGNGAAYDKDKA